LKKCCSEKRRARANWDSARKSTVLIESDRRWVSMTLLQACNTASDTAENLEETGPAEKTKRRRMNILCKSHRHYHYQQSKGRKQIHKSR